MEGQDYLFRSHRFSRPLVTTKLGPSQEEIEAAAAAAKKAKSDVDGGGDGGEYANAAALTGTMPSAKQKLYARLEKEAAKEEARVKLEYERAQEVDPLERKRQERAAEKERVAKVRETHAAREGGWGANNTHPRHRSRPYPHPRPHILTLTPSAPLPSPACRCGRRSEQKRRQSNKRDATS